MTSVSFRLLSPFLAVGLVAGAIPFANGSADDPRAEQVVLTSTASSGDLAAEKRYLELVERTEAVAGQTVEQAAIAVADGLSAVPVSAEEPDVPCPGERLAVRWSEPGDEYRHGAFVPPLGPTPGAETEAVNGIVVCAGSPYAYMGFEADLQAAGWHVTAVPYLGDETGEAANDDADPHGHAHGHGEVEEDDHGHDEPSSPAPRLELPTTGALGPIEGYAAYEPQRICHATVKPGTEALKQLLLGRYPVTRNLGIVRGCSIGGRSEHKEGRAFDWGAYVSREDERKAADDLIGRLLATDTDGNRHALARRMGIMYMIWNGRIWSAHRAADGWRPYGGASPHTDHVHISLSWDGAMARTSYWRANGVDALLAMPVGSVTGPGPAGGTRPGTTSPAPTTHRDDDADAEPGHDHDQPKAGTSDDRKAREEDTRDGRRQQEDAREGERDAERARRRAEEEARENQERAQRERERERERQEELEEARQEARKRERERQQELDKAREEEREEARKRERERQEDLEEAHEGERERSRDRKKGKRDD